MTSIVSLSGELQKLLATALRQVGVDDKGKAKMLLAQLEELYITTPDVLREALVAHESLGALSAFAGRLWAIS